MLNKKRIAILLGDPSGIGPEIVSKLLCEKIIDNANILVIGERKILEEGENISGKKGNFKFVNNSKDIVFDDETKFFLDISKGTNRTYKYGQVSAESGASVLEAMDEAMDLANNKKIDAVNFGPMNKSSLIMGGCPYNDEHDYFQKKLKMKDFCCEFNVIDNFWTARNLTYSNQRSSRKYYKRKYIKTNKTINKTLKMSGIEKPRIAVQALNPHAEFGTEEKDEIIPAIEEAKKMGIDADGPLPCDTSFITAYKNKNHDCIIGMYHDALQCGLKAFGFDRGVTVSGGLSIPITTPAHGTAFDIVTKNSANMEPMLNSFKLALKMSSNA